MNGTDKTFYFMGLILSWEEEDKISRKPTNDSMLELGHCCEEKGENIACQKRARVETYRGSFCTSPPGFPGSSLSI